ncbi:maleylacetoacetate isomerase [Pelagibius sp.]|uniref:maleylacetoacetate isomerase n=1 Tax=Pelagibius sp. TaxID=1931238 RepID=UPI003BAF7822
MRLYTYFRSSAAYRVRIAMALKGLSYEQSYVNTLRQEHRTDAYAAVNPQRLVPALDDDGLILAQSLSIIEYLEEKHPEPPLLPSDLPGRARVRALAQTIACDIHPINNLRILRYLEQALGADEAAITAWYRHWITEGFDGFEALLASSPDTGSFCHGDSPTLADICLAPQVYNAERFGADLSAYPIVRRINAACLEQAAFADTWPDRQPDADI